MVFFGLFLPIVCIQIFGAVVAVSPSLTATRKPRSLIKPTHHQLSAQAIPSWSAASEISVPSLLYALVGTGNPGRFVMVLMALSVTANTAPTIYSCGLSAMVLVPKLVRGKSGEKHGTKGMGANATGRGVQCHGIFWQSW